MSARPKEHVEREAKLGAGPDFALPDLAGLPGGVVLAEPTVVELDAIYLDTADLRLVRAGITVRHRHDGRQGEWTVKLPEDGAADAALLRREHTVAAVRDPDHGAAAAHRTGEPGPVPPELDALVRAVARTAPLTAVARLRTTRRGFVLRDGEGRTCGEVDDDEVAVVCADRVKDRFREIEVEVSDGAPAELLEAVVARLRAAGAGAHDPSPKLARALGPAAGSAPDVVPRRVGDEASAAEVIGAALTSSVARIVDHDRVIRAGTDPEGVHQARVGTRRLRSDLRTFRPLLDTAWSEPLRAELKWIAAELGRARDADVLCARFERQIDGLGVEDRVMSAPLLDQLRHQRDEARRELMAALAERRYLELLERLVQGANQPRLDADPGAAAAAAGPARDVLPGLVARRWRKLRRAVAGLGTEPGDDALHQVRIRAKRARYAADVAVPVVGKPAAALASALSDLQDVLGDLHDASVAEAWLRDAARAAGPGAAFAAGMMTAGQRAEGAERRGQWKPAWKAARAGKRTSWLS